MAKRTWGVPTSFPTKRGEWGSGYQIEKNYTNKRVSCYMCAFLGDHSSCRKYGTFIPRIGSDSWKSCKSFLLSLQYSNQFTNAYVIEQKGEGFIQKENSPVALKHENKFTGFEQPVKHKKTTSFKYKHDLKLEAYFADNSIPDINIDLINRALNSFDDSSIKVHPKIVRNICLQSLAKMKDPLEVINSAEDKLAKFLYYHPEFNSDKQIDALLIKIITSDLSLKLPEIIELSEEKAKTLVEMFYSSDWFDSLDNIFDDQYYFCTEEYVLAKNNATKGILNHYNSETGVLIDLDPVDKWLTLYNDSFEDEDNNAYITRLLFHRWPNSFYDQRIPPGSYVIDYNVEYNEEHENDEYIG